MASKSSIEIRLTGKRGTEPLSPDNVGVSFLIEALSHMRTLLEVTEADDPNVTLHEGSLALRHSGMPETVDELAYQLKLVGNSLAMDAVPNKISKALRGLQKLTLRYGDTVIISQENQPLLSLDRQTTFTESAPTFVDAEIYIRGKVTNAGGIGQPNIHIQTDDVNLGTLLVDTTEEQLSGDEKNRLYKPVTMRISIKENAETGEYDLKSARLLEVIETAEVAPSNISSYVDQLIERAKGSWSDVGDKEEWLKNIRGYEG
jgi:hypothetical protein